MNSALGHLLLAGSRESIRHPETIFWTFVFPILLAFALGIAFRGERPDPAAAVVVDLHGAADVARTLRENDDVRVKVLSRAAADRLLRTGGAAGLVIPGDPLVYRYDPTRPDSRLARERVDRILQREAGRTDRLPASDSLVTEPGARYIDFFVPGLLGVHLIGGGLWGVGGHGGRGALLRGARAPPGEPRPDDRDDLGADQPRHLPDDRPLGGLLLRQPVPRLPPAADPGPAAHRPDRRAPGSHDRRGAPRRALAPVPGDGPGGGAVLRRRPVGFPVDVSTSSRKYGLLLGRFPARFPQPVPRERGGDSTPLRSRPATARCRSARRNLRLAPQAASPNPPPR